LKKLLSYLVITMLCMVSTLLAQDARRDPRVIATAFALSGKEAGYEGDFYYYVAVNGAQEWMHGAFQAAASADGSMGAITNLWIGGEQVPLAEPLARLPHDARGTMTYFSLHLYGYNAAGQQVSNGSMNTKLLAAGDPIRVTVRPAYVRQFIPMPVPEGVQAEDLLLVTGDGNRHSYSTWYGGFNISLDPADGPQDYVLIDGHTGLVVGSGGMLYPHKGVEQSSDNSVQILREEAVEYADLDAGWWQTTGWRQLDSETEIDGQLQQAKVFYMDCKGDDLGIHIYGAWKGSTAVRIDEVLADGGLRHIKTGTEVLYDYEIRFNADQPLGKVLVTVYGETAADNGFQIYLWRRYYAPWASSPKG
jgi:hypothetical protein